ncbi:MAG: Mrp/NBP35 family ATP-binding protein [Candidatus Nanopelagicaceae bacterium]|jgi:ATP-binding protein involved in chromosome partitioning|nr:Mrp/NBP35 family ATP-binding protein [Candidatus Nanopelagicaceae bacterium]
MSSEITQAIHQALATVSDPELHRPLPDLGMVESVAFNNGIAQIKILLTISGCPMRERLHNDVLSAVSQVPGVSSVELEFGVMNETQRDNVKKLLRGGREKFIPFAQPDSLTRVWGISSGKGGVGKSSVTVNLAAALSSRGFKVGVLDADVYGHSIPRLFGIEGVRPTAIDQTFIPVEVRGIKVVSIEMFKPDRADPVAYRGPLLHRVLEQLLSDAYWGDLDFLLLDLPPGTGDIAISLGQLIPASEIIVVTTPQVAAAEVAERAGRIAHQLKQHIIGVIENMSAYVDAQTGATIALFGEGGGAETSRRLSTLVGAEVPLVASVPFDVDLREGGDNGAPIVWAKPESPAAQSFFSVVDQLAPRKKSLLGVRLGVST